MFKNGMEVPALLGIGPLSVKPMYIVSCDLGVEGSAAEGNIPKDLIKSGASGCQFVNRIRQVILQQLHMAWGPPKVQLIDLGLEGLKGLFNNHYQGSSTLTTLNSLEGWL